MAGKRAAGLSPSKVRRGSPRNLQNARVNPIKDASESEGSTSDGVPTHKAKRRKTGDSSAARSAVLRSRLFGESTGQLTCDAPCILPTRQHTLDYHRPLLLHDQRGRQARQSLLHWFDSISTARAMPWRKAWINPRNVSEPVELRRVLERRAYEVWISEIMLQQTRVAVVIEYWKRWMAKWPTIQELAKAEPDDVLAAWRGLGYYSRATRIHDAAKLVTRDETMRGLLPESTDQLEAKVPGVGRYTAGAISAIVFGQPAPMVDGNVLRVLSRLLGIYGNVKTDKTVIDLLWVTADELVKVVARDRPADSAKAGCADTQETSDRPGRWGQALMELGSTICTPKPNCSACPVSSSCRVYDEGSSAFLGERSPQTIVDVEDLCDICESFEGDEPAIEDAKQKNSFSTTLPARGSRSDKQITLASFAFTREAAKRPELSAKQSLESRIDMDRVANYARKFPRKVTKKAVREEETLVCAVQCTDGRYLIHRRPEKGLLAGLWEFPSLVLEGPNTNTSKERQQLARSHTVGVLKENGHDHTTMRYKGELGSVPWVFSHLKLTMHVHLFTIEDPDGSEIINKVTGVADKARRWTRDVESESMGTGMRKCWGLVRGVVS